MRQCRRSLMISLDKCLARFTQVTISHTLAGGIRLRRVIHTLHIQGHGGGVIKRAQHATYIFIRAVLAAPFMQRARRLAFKVDQIRIALDHQDLPQVQVTVDPNAQTAGRGFRQSLDTAGQRFFLPQHFTDQRLIGGVQLALMKF